MGVKRSLSLGASERRGKMCSTVVITFKSVRRVTKRIVQSEKLNITVSQKRIMRQIRINQRFNTRDYSYELPQQCLSINFSTHVA